MTGTQAGEAKVLKVARTLDARMRARPRPPVSLFDRLMDSAMGDEALRADLFRLLDVLPVLAGDEEVSRHVREYLLDRPRRLPPVLSAALQAAGARAFSGIAARTIRSVAAQMAERFIVGAAVPVALGRLEELHRAGFASSADLLGEAAVSEVEADAFLRSYAELLQALTAQAARWAPHPLVDESPRGPVPRANISLKLSSLAPRLDPLDHDRCVQLLAGRLLPLYEQAMSLGASLTIDMEQWDLHGIAWDVFEDLVSRPRLAGWPWFGIVVQAYLVLAHRDADRLLSLARRRGTPLCVRVVKGAYWDYEVAHARLRGLPCPVLVGKERTDVAFEALSELLLRSTDRVYPGIGSHNLRSVSRAIAVARETGVPTGSFEIQCLYGMADAQRDALRDMGVRVRVYSPIGELLPGIAYLVRRLLENSANTGFLRQAAHEKRSIEELIARPVDRVEPADQGDPAARGEQAAQPSAAFINCPSSDFCDPAVRERFAAALARQRTGLPINVPLRIAGGHAGGDSEQRAPLVHHCPGSRGQDASVMSCAAAEDAARAVEAAGRAWPGWRDASIEVRAGLLERLADALERDRVDLAALQCLEVGKPIREADADVAEAVDLCRYYARRARIELAPHRRDDLPGEDNVTWYEGRGVAAVVAPWNFPLAILCGMTCAALVSGNTVIMKPAEQSAASALRLWEALQASGAPEGVAQLLPGTGEEAGAALVSHPGVAQVAFTGSRDVGLEILARSARVSPGQSQLKRVVCEMGGKNAIIVDDDADLDEAVPGVLASAFGFAGQKCSACSRLIVVAGIYGRLLPRLVEAVKSLRIALPEDPSCELGPVIDEPSWSRLTSMIRDPGPGVHALYRGGSVPESGWFVPPAIFGVDDRMHPIARRELFGPVLAVIRVPGFEEALEAALDSEYALTGGLYSRSPSRIEAARRRFRVGNLYLNRPITGAMADRQPFGGFRLSGGGTKAGGPGYLRNFVDPRSACENTMRKGFVPGPGPQSVGPQAATGGDSRRRTR